MFSGKISGFFSDGASNLEIDPGIIFLKVIKEKTGCKI
jgi:hypothetical protein